MQSYVSFAKVKAKPMTWLEYELLQNDGDIYVVDGGEEITADEDGYLIMTEVDEKTDYVTWMSKDVFNKIYMPLVSDLIM